MLPTLLPALFLNQVAGRLIRPSEQLVREHFTWPREELVTDRWLQANTDELLLAYHAGLDLAAAVWTQRGARHIPAIDGQPLHAELDSQLMAMNMAGWWSSGLKVLVGGEWVSSRRGDVGLGDLLERGRSMTAMAGTPHEHLDGLHFQLFSNCCGYFNDAITAAYMLEDLAEYLREAREISACRIGPETVE